MAFWPLLAAATGETATLPELAWTFDPPSAQDEDADQRPVSFRHLPPQVPESLWRYLTRVDVTDPEAVAAGLVPEAPQPTPRASEPPLDRPAWAAGPFIGPLYDEMGDDRAEFLDKLAGLIQDARRAKDDLLADTLGALRALACLRQGQTATAKGVFAQLRKCPDPRIRAFALAYGHVLRRHPDGTADGKNLGDWLVLRSIGGQVVGEVVPRLKRAIAASKIAAKGSPLVLRRAAEKVDGYKDQLRMLDLLEPGSAEELIPGVLQQEHDIRAALLDLQIQDTTDARGKVVEAAGTIRPRFTYNRAARKLLDEIGTTVDFIPLDRVREHNDLLRVFHRRWARALAELRAFDEYLVVVQTFIPRPMSDAQRARRAGVLWSAPFVDDLPRELQDYYYDKERVRGRVFYELKPSTKPARGRSR